MTNKKIIFHGNDPWDLPGNTKDTALSFAVMYCISRDIPYKKMAEYLNIPLSKIQEKLFDLRERSVIKLKNGKYTFIQKPMLHHLYERISGEIYDAVVPHIKSEYFRIDDVGLIAAHPICSDNTSYKYAVRFLYIPKDYVWDKRGIRSYNWWYTCKWRAIGPADAPKEQIIEKIIKFFTHEHERLYKFYNPVIIKKDPILSYSI